MLNRIIDFSLQRRGFVIFITLLFVLAGLWSATRVAIDAVPDITSPQVQVNTPVDALAPEEIETLVTVPIEIEMSGLPGMVELRSLSKFGLSQITMTFRDGTDIYRTRQLVTERLAHARENLPAGVAPGLAPISTGLGEIVYYTVRYKADAPGRPADRIDQLRALLQLHDYTIKPLLRATPGLAEVNAIGGYEKQIVIEPDPKKLADAGVSFDQLADVIAKSTENAGGGLLELGGEAIVVRADAARSRTSSPRVRRRPGRCSSPGHHRHRSAVRTGASTGTARETVTGAAVMLAGENSRLVARAVVARLRVIEEKLPPGIELRVVYDRSDLVHATINTVRTNLFEGAVLVAAILFALLGHWRAATIVTLAIPLSFLFMLTGMAQGRLSANLMSLGAIDFGLIVDGSIVMVEHIFRRLAGRQHALGRLLSPPERLAEVGPAHEWARPMFFGVLIILLVYAPVIALTGIEGNVPPMARRDARRRVALRSR
jgi:cobalt-zinc-cadmium resistance protein CzcA